MNIWDMGLVYDIRIADNGNIDIDMTLTAPGCPVAGILPQQAADATVAWLRGQASSRSKCLGAGLVDGTPERRCPRDDGIILRISLMDIEELIDNFSFCDSWEDRYGYIIDLGSSLEGLDDKFENRGLESPRLSVAGLACARI